MKKTRIRLKKDELRRIKFNQSDIVGILPLARTHKKETDIET